jgi:hypothetical protein
MRPPASTETLIHLERVLHEKVKESSHVVDVFPSLSLTGDAPVALNTPRVSEAIRSTLEEWACQPFTADVSEPCFAAVSASVEGFLALCEVDNALHLIANNGDGLSLDPVRIVEVMQYCSGEGILMEQDLIDRTVVKIRRYFDGLRMTDGLRPTAGARARRAGLKRIARIVSQARPHDRGRVSSLASLARSSLTSRIGAEAERRLESLSTEPISDAAWMEEIAAIGRKRRTNSGSVKVIAAILLLARQETVTRATKR